MASQSRQSKGNRKPGSDSPANRYMLSYPSYNDLASSLPSRRTPAWGQGARASPTFSPGPARQQQQQQQQPPTPATPMTFPPLSQPNGARSDNARDRDLQAISSHTVRRHCLRLIRYLIPYSIGFSCHPLYKIRPTL